MNGVLRRLSPLHTITLLPASQGSLREQAVNEQGEPKVLSLREEAANEQGEPKVLPVTPFLRPLFVFRPAWLLQKQKAACAASCRARDPRLCRQAFYLEPEVQVVAFRAL
jgi:hypothetical protein